jgi:hypothetical protein
MGVEEKEIRSDCQQVWNFFLVGLGREFEVK